MYGNYIFTQAWSEDNGEQSIQKDEMNLSSDEIQSSSKRTIFLVSFLSMMVITGVVVCAGKVVLSIFQRVDDRSASLFMNNIVEEPNQNHRNEDSPFTNSTFSMKMKTHNIVRTKLIELDQRIEGKVWFSDDDDAIGFVEAASVWVHVDPPLAVVEACTESDVIRIVPVLVELKQRYHIGFSIRAGGHHKAGYSTLPGGVVLSLKNMNRIQLLSSSDSLVQSNGIQYNNIETAIARIQPGVRDEDFLYHLLHSHGYGGVFGYCPTVGIAGFAMGGGLGIQSRLYGLGLDQIVGARVVLANGTLVEVNANTDLVWALRGAGGGNFGVVTELQYRVVRAHDGLAVLSVTLPTPSFHQNDLTVDFMSRLGDLEANGKLASNLVAMFDGWDQVNLIWSAHDEETFLKGPAYIEDLVSNRMGPKIAKAPRKSVSIQWTEF